MNESLKIKTLIMILIAGILLTSSNSMPLVNAQSTPTSLTLAVSSPPRGKPFWSECTMEATLKDENGNPLPNMDILFSECGSVREIFGTAKTDSNGVASLTCSFPGRARTYPMMANFSGTTSYVKSSSEYVDIILVDYTPVLVGIIPLAIVGYIVFRRTTVKKDRETAND